MDRRDALKKMAFLTGGALSLSTVSAVLGGCTAESGGYSPRTLSTEQDEMVAVISEHIIPATDTPGAQAAKVNQFIDKMLTDWHTENEREHFLSGLASVDEISNTMYGNDFLELGNQEQISILEQKEQQAQTDSMPGSGLNPFFEMIKELTIVGYYTSEIGATEELRWNHIAGRYDGCYAYSEVGRAWSS